MEITTIYFLAGVFTAYSSLLVPLSVAYYYRDKIKNYLISKAMGRML